MRVLNYHFVPAWIHTFHCTSPWITVLTTGTHQGKGLNTSTVEEETVRFFYGLVNPLGYKTIIFIELVLHRAHWLMFDRFWPNTLIDALYYYSVRQWSSV